MKSPRNWSVGAFAVTQGLMTVALLGFLIFVTSDNGRGTRFVWDQVLPTWVLAGGALGGCFVSLVGIAMHTVDWDSSRYAYWHLFRPLLGMISGSVAVLILLFVLKGIAPNVMPATDASYTPSGIAVMFVISFVVGYREETFRELVKRVVDVVLGPGETADKSKIAIIPSLVQLATDQGGAPKETTLTLFNGTEDTLSLSTALSWVSDPPDVLHCEVKDPDTPIGPSGQRLITLRWEPGNPPAPMTGTLTVKVGGYGVTATVTGSVSP
jgi:hypothetical protein